MPDCDGVTFEMPTEAAREVAPPTAGWTWRMQEQQMTSRFVVGLRTVSLEWFHPWREETPAVGSAFRVDQPDITTEAYLQSAEWELRGRERWLRLTAVGSGVPTIREPINHGQTWRYGAHGVT